MFDYEVRRTFNNDMLLAFISSSCIAVLVYILTSCSGRLQSRLLCSHEKVKHAVTPRVCASPGEALVS